MLQMNARKRNPSTIFINQRVSKMDAFVAFIQENSVDGKNPTNLDKQHHRVFCKDSKPRAVLYAHANLSIWPLNQFCDRDVAAALFHSGNKTRLLLSVYWDCTKLSLIHI